MTKTRILIIDDHPLFRSALRLALEPAIDGVEIIEASSIEDLEKGNDTLRGVDLILLDLLMPGVHGLLGLLLLRCEHPQIPVAVVSANDDQDVVARAIACGASGYITKNQPIGTLRQAVHSILDGEIWTPEAASTGTSALAAEAGVLQSLATLSPRQVRVLSLLCEGLLNSQMAEFLNITEATVKAHVSAVLQKLGARNRTHAVVIANRLTGCAQLAD